MDINEIRQLKKESEKQISDILMNIVATTGLRIESLKMEVYENMAAEPVEIVVKINVNM